MLDKQPKMIAGVTPPAIAISFAFVGALIGCNSGSSNEDFGSAVGKVAVSDTLQQEAKAATEQVADSLKHKDFVSLQHKMTPQMVAKTPPGGLVTGRYEPISGASDWVIANVDVVGRKQSIVVHASFVGADGKGYTTNLSFVKVSGKLLLADILIPVHPSKPIAKGSQTHQSPK